MLRSLWTSQSGMTVQQINLDVIANNLANVNTVGFKKARPEFQDLLYQTLNTPGSNNTTTTISPTGVQVGLGAKLVSTNRAFEQGSLKGTGRPLDLAISGDGFFEMTLPDGTQGYTRNGSFAKDENGNIVDASGNTLNPNITIPPSAVAVSVGKDGSVTVDLGDGAPQNVGQIQLATFINPKGLKAIGDNLFQVTQASGDAIVGAPNDPGFGSIESRFLEMSNVDIAEEMINMITGQRAYEAVSRSIRTADQVLSELNSLKR
ncbi:MAG: flagellar basal-body rod protein FlgG [Acidobacteria bacterium]|nr:MAG: flagellar basal-body rod protein FlgG [Acidobacteriota bacterium]PIE89013.1 MAG: flagellar basal-body rod protein FlgG [Acidobacteriota bacterium]